MCRNEQNRRQFIHFFYRKLCSIPTCYICCADMINDVSIYAYSTKNDYFETREFETNHSHDNTLCSNHIGPNISAFWADYRCRFVDCFYMHWFPVISTKHCTHKRIVQSVRKSMKHVFVNRAISMKLNSLRFRLQVSSNR